MVSRVLTKRMIIQHRPTSRPPEQADPQRVLATNCAHLDDCSENITRLRRFAVGVTQCFSKEKSGVAQKMCQMNRNTRLVFDYLRMTRNSTLPCLP
jgi:hypothetical protein